MKKKKQGFTLAELLITLSIMAIVTTMGLTIAKKSIQKAYNGYYYTGYNTLMRILNEAEYRYDTPFDDLSTNGNLYKEIISKYLTIKNTDKSEPSRLGFTTSSNIYYVIVDAYNYDPNGNKWYMMYMTIPQAKSEESPNGNKKITLGYYPGITPYIIPIDSVADRVDLLPCYIDNGEQGRLGKCANQEDDNNNPKYTPCADQTYKQPQLISLKEALCTTVKDLEINIKRSGYCTTGSRKYTFNANKENMAIKFVAPRKVRH